MIFQAPLAAATVDLMAPTQLPEVKLAMRLVMSLAALFALVTRPPSEETIDSSAGAFSLISALILLRSDTWLLLQTRISKRMFSLRVWKSGRYCERSTSKAHQPPPGGAKPSSVLESTQGDTMYP